MAQRPDVVETEDEVAEQQVWDLWYPDAAAQGLPFARSRLDGTDVLLVHAAPESLDVAVRSDAQIAKERAKAHFEAAPFNDLSTDQLDWLIDCLEQQQARRGSAQQQGSHDRETRQPKCAT